MGKRIALVDELKKSKNNLRFERLCLIAESFGFRCRGGKGSHRIYVKKGIKEMLNFQNVGGKAKPYQVNQLLKVIENNNLLKEESDV